MQKKYCKKCGHECHCLYSNHIGATSHYTFRNPCKYNGHISKNKYIKKYVNPYEIITFDNEEFYTSKDNKIYRIDETDYIDEEQEIFDEQREIIGYVTEIDYKTKNPITVPITNIGTYKKNKTQRKIAIWLIDFDECMCTTCICDNVSGLAQCETNKLVHEKSLDNTCCVII